MSLEASQVRNVMIDGVTIHAVTERRCIQEIIIALREGRGGWVVTHNVDHIRRLQTDIEFAHICDTADLRVADGAPVVWASKLTGGGVPERVAGSSLIHSLSAAAARYRLSVFLLGGDVGTAQSAADFFLKKFPELRIAGTFCPPLGFESDPSMMATMRSRLIGANPDIVFVGLGSPKQEKLIVELRRIVPNAWMLGVGISFSFVSGHVKRAPKWAQSLGLEWLHRLIQEPGRLARRYLVEGIPFVLGMFARTAHTRWKRDRAKPPLAAMVDPVELVDDEDSAGLSANGPV